MCNTLFKEISDGAKELGRDGTFAKQLVNAPEFSPLQLEFAAQKDPATNRFPLHPKMVELKNLVVQHFGKFMADSDEQDGEAAINNSRIMVFASFREVVDEIIDILNEEKPLIRAMKLIGQGSDKQGNAGLNQKQQQAVSRQFDLLTCSYYSHFLSLYRFSIGLRQVKATYWSPRPLARRVSTSERSTWSFVTMRRKHLFVWYAFECLYVARTFFEIALSAPTDRSYWSKARWLCPYFDDRGT